MRFMSSGKFTVIFLLKNISHWPRISHLATTIHTLFPVQLQILFTITVNSPCRDVFVRTAEDLSAQRLWGFS